VANHVQLGGVYTYYEVDGRGDPLVLLHPGGADSRVFESMLPALTERYIDSHAVG
jgi:pimeloyl-ACP methyl ester carboxylesterase